MASKITEALDVRNPHHDSHHDKNPVIIALLALKHTKAQAEPLQNILNSPSGSSALKLPNTQPSSTCGAYLGSFDIHISTP